MPTGTLGYEVVSEWNRLFLHERDRPNDASRSSLGWSRRLDTDRIKSSRSHQPERMWRACAFIDKTGYRHLPANGGGEKTEEPVQLIGIGDVHITIRIARNRSEQRF